MIFARPRFHMFFQWFSRALELQATPLNGAIGFFPSSHLLTGDLSGSKPQEMVGTSAPGSVILYDSFTEHRGLENESSEP